MGEKKHIIKRILVTAVTIFLFFYCVASIVFNAIAIHGVNSTAVDRAIEQIKAGKNTIIVDQDLIDPIACRIECDPDLFYIALKFSYSSIWYLPPFDKIALNIYHEYDDTELLQKQKELDEATTAALSEIDIKSATDFEKATYAYVWVIQNLEYKNIDDSHSVYNAIINKNAVCSGYANAMVHLLSQMGIEAYSIGGKAIADNGEAVPHAWVLAYLDENPYYFDPTWGDKALHPDVQKKYFAISPQEFISTHTADACFSNTFNDANFDCKIDSMFDCDDEVKVLSEIYRKYNEQINDLQDADITKEELISMINEKMGKDGSYSQYVNIDSELSYIDEKTGELNFETDNSYVIGSSCNGLTHLISSRKSTDSNSEIDKLYFTSEAYINTLTLNMCYRTTLHDWTTNWTHIDNFTDEQNMFVSYSNLLPEDMAVKIDKDGNYILIALATEPIIQGYFATFAPIDYGTYIVGIVDKDISSLCLYVENVQLNQDYLYEEFDAINASSSVDIFVKLYNFGQIQNVEMPNIVNQ